MAEFVHLHVHSDYSLLDGGNNVVRLTRRAAETGQRALALTDHGNLFGAVSFYLAARAAGIKPILGMEAYIAPRGRRETGGGMKDVAAHLVLLAMNGRGWQNLMRLSTLAYLEGFYYKPRIDLELLARHHEGLVCTSACLSGQIPSALLRGRLDEARRIGGVYRDIFGPERFFIEIQNQGVEDQTRINPDLVELAKWLGVGLVGTNDVHFLHRDDKEAHFLLTCISTNRHADDPDALHHPEELYLKTPDEMAEALKAWPEAVTNTLRIAEMCDVTLDLQTRHLPRFDPPDGSTPDDYLRRIAFEGLARRFEGREPLPEYRERLERELRVIADKGYSSYFLIIHDIVRYAREHDIPASPRGSGVATLLGYALGIAHVDPIRYGLIFERFTDPQRKEDPDVDIDLCQVGRETVLQYVRQRYRHVAQIITYGTLKPRAVIRDLGRVKGWPLDRVDRLAALVPESPKATLDRVLGLAEAGDEEENLYSPELARAYQEDPEVRALLDKARELEGKPRHAGVHAAGVVICDQPLEDIVPLCRQAGRPEVMTQWDHPTCEKVGLMKMDLLGLKTLSVIQRARELVRQRTGVDRDPNALSLDDDKVYDVFRRGDVDGIFQFESAGMRRVLVDMQPTRIEDLIAANAMYRPGPMQFIADYCARKHGRQPVPKVHPLVDDLLAETYGIMVYQEQVMQVLHRLGNFPLSRALSLIKAISKKKAAEFDKAMPDFVAGAAAHGIPADEARRLFALIKGFAGYGFNKAHSTGYAIVAYQTAWFKCHHPAEFWAATLSFESDDLDKLGQYMAAARKGGQRILPPDVNVSGVNFTVDDDGAIRFGLAAIKGVGEAAVAAILSAREAEGGFRDLFHFCAAVDRRAVNRSTIEALIRCGAFDRCGIGHRAQMLAVLDAALASANAVAADRARGQMALFADEEAAAPRRWPDVPAWSPAEILAAERATLGFTLAGHPTDEVRFEVAALRWPRDLYLSRPPSADGAAVRVCAAVAGVQRLKVRGGRTAGRDMAVLQLDDGETGEIEAVLYPDALDACPPGLLAEDAVVVMEGAIKLHRGRPCLEGHRVESVDDALARLVVRLCLQWAPEHLADVEWQADLLDTLRSHAGRCPVRFWLDASEWSHRRVAVDVSAACRVRPSRALLAALGRLFPPGAIACDTRPAAVAERSRRTDYRRAVS